MFCFKFCDENHHIVFLCAKELTGNQQIAIIDFLSTNDIILLNKLIFVIPVVQCGLKYNIHISWNEGQTQAK